MHFLYLILVDRLKCCQVIVFRTQLKILQEPVLMSAALWGTPRDPAGAQNVKYQGGRLKCSNLT